MNLLMLYQALEEYRLPEGVQCLHQEEWRSVGVQAWRNRLHCLFENGIHTVSVWACVEGEQLHLTIVDEAGACILGEPGHDPDIARRELEAETWVDPASELMWLRRPVAGPFLTLNPFRIIQELRHEHGIGTFCDWQLPTIDELQTLVPASNAEPYGPIHPVIAACLADPERCLVVYGHRPKTGSMPTTEDPDERARSTRVTGFRFPDGVELAPPDNDTFTTISHCQPEIEQQTGSQDINVLAVRATC